MRKNKMMRLASALLVAVLLSTCAISGTFAKYVTEATASDNARVAAWGFGTSSTLTFNLFDPSYDTTVNSFGGDVIAPGTDKTDAFVLNYADTTGKGAPEVDYKVTLKVDNANTSIADDIKKNANITWSFNGSAFGTWDDMIAAINAYTENVEANSLPTIATGLEIKWQWAFEGGSTMYDHDGDPATTELTQDQFDTYMGDKATADSVKLAIIFTATQVD